MGRSVQLGARLRLDLRLPALGGREHRERGGADAAAHEHADEHAADRHRARGHRAHALILRVRAALLGIRAARLHR